jgi:hypothetical protein
MADSDSQDSAKASQVSVAVEEEMTDQQLDQMIGEEDPEFLKTVSEIGRDTHLSLSQIFVSDEDQTLNEEKDAWAQSKGFWKFIYRIFPLAPYVSLKVKKWKYGLFVFVRAEKIRIKNFLFFLATDGKEKVIKKLKTGKESIIESSSAFALGFKKLSWKLKLFALGLIVMAAATGFYIHRVLTHGFFHGRDELFMPTLERIATEVHEYDPEKGVEPFYGNLRATSNVLLIPKMVVNLKRSPQSGPNPMGAFEFYVEGMAPEVTIEVKDREVEIRDLMQRVIEEFTFDQVDSVEGKKLLLEKLKKEVNTLLTTGKLKKVTLKTVIVKP